MYIRKKNYRMAAKAKVEKYKVQFKVTERNFAKVTRHRWLF